MVPFGPAGPLSVTVPVDGLPPATELGLSDKLASAAGLIVSVADRLLPASAAEREAGVGVSTPVVVAVNVAEVWPAATVTVEGTVAAALLELKLITRPALGAPLEIVTVPIEPVPPVTELGFSVRLVRVGALIVRMALTAWPPLLAQIFALVSVPTGTVVMVNVADVIPAGIVTLAGTVAALASL